MLDKQTPVKNISYGTRQVRRVLLVDDNDNALRAMKKFLELDGYDVTTVRDGEAALAMARAADFDAIVLDIQLPGKNGYEIALLLRQEIHSEALLIALTGYYGEPEDKLLAQAAGFDYYLTRPVLVADIEKLFKTIGTIPRTDRSSLPPSPGV